MTREPSDVERAVNKEARDLAENEVMRLQKEVTFWQSRVASELEQRRRG